MGLFGGSPQDQVDVGHLKDRVARLETAVAALQAQVAAGTITYAAPAAPGAVPGAAPPDTSWMAEVRGLKARGKTIHAIKAYREHTGVGLKEAKDAVDALY